MMNASNAAEALIGDSDIEMVDAVLLAAGGARRFGSPKLLALLRGSPLLWHSLDALRDTDVGERCLVLGSDAEAIHRCYLDWCHARGLLVNFFEVRVNEAWEDGLSSSIRCGIERGLERSLERGGEAGSVLLALADQPCVSAFHLGELVNACDATSDVVASDYDGIAGVPAVFSARAHEALLGLQGDEGARRILNEGNALRVRRIPFAPSERIDVDVPADIERADAEGSVIRLPSAGPRSHA